ncbi:protein GAMETE EXPRESSED 1-like [Papaver somniferum]|uniref:protein GAMETE EXPRESSED 1-like n=1 Tax=Papaver somniferum TaxID=3469 RepID=UPI000E6F46F5|nr:protein GAMETE EXPRESSED 1-like [Papaver somniferum]
MAYCLSRVLFFALVLICSSEESYSFSFGWRSPTSSSDETNTKTNNDHMSYKKSDSPSGVALFSMEPLNEPNGIKLVEDAKQYLDSPNSCWRNAYRSLFATCPAILSDNEKKSRLAWELSDCFQTGSGRPFPKCNSRAKMQTCCKKLDDSAHKIYHGYYLKTDSICHQLQADAFKYETERLVNGLKKSAELAEEKLENIQDKSETLVQKSDEIYKSITSLDRQTQLVAETTKTVQNQMDVQLKHSNIVLEKSKEIVASQLNLLEGQSDMRTVMAMLHESHENLSHNVDKLKNEAVEIGKEINQVSNSMSTKMENLQNKADDVGNAVEISLDKQKQLLDGQSTALERLKFQSQALKESGATLQTLADFSRHQQEQLLKGQEQLRLAQDQIVEESKSILAAQEAFSAKQANMLLELDRHFTLINRILLDTGLIKACLFYPFVLFLLSVLTSFKRTYHMRGWLLLGLAVTFFVEISSRMYWYGLDLDKQVTMGKNSFSF